MNHILAVQTWKHNQYVGFEARELWKDEERHTDDIYSWQSHQYNKAKSYEKTSAIQLYAQSNYEAGKGYTKLYGFEIKTQENITSGNLDEAEAVLKRIKKIQTQYTQMCNKLGAPETFSQYAAYIAHIIKADLAIYDEDMKTYRTTETWNISYTEKKLLNNEA